MRRDWLDLMANLDIVGHPYVSSPEEILEFEQIAGFILPEQYKEFCMVCGGMYFDKTELSIHQVGYYDVQSYLDEDFEKKDICISQNDGQYEMQELVQNSRHFGLGTGYTFLIWDLRTYSENDKSYDIYILRDWGNGTMDALNLGRDFYVFVKDYCTGEKMNREFAEILGFDVDSDFRIVNKLNSVRCLGRTH
jgi:SMI1-KNR4 cell-wall